ncbi:TIGR03545 family protein [Catenovulum agarivorans]|uniref:TIGR03545 family protein n=1 Tax=Catenovulum agarivorans TaxID=1172192 RepID=UPI000308A153|nr:TIGR03545 family protein [Catenovulum agarivorans]
MKKYLRWQGFAGFVAVIALLAASVYLFAGSLIKLAIEQLGERVYGAEINVEKVNVNWSPVSVELVHLQVTDKQNPANNLVEFNTAVAAIDLWQYLLGKTLITDLQVAKLQLDKQRAEPGKVYDVVEAAEESSQKTSKIDEIKAEIPDVKTLLNDSNLITVEKAQALQTTLTEERAKIKQLKAELPDKSKLKEYEAKIKQLTDTEVDSLEDLAKLKEQLDELKADIKQDKAKFKQAKEQLSDSNAKLKLATKELKEAPEQDWQQVKQTYQLETFEAEDLAHILFGEEARSYYQYAEKAYKLLKPFIKKGNDGQADEVEQSVGRFVHFDEENPIPDWMVAQGKIELVNPKGTIWIELKDIHVQHWKKTTASRVDVFSNAFAQGDLKGQLDYWVDQDSNIKSQANWQFNDLKVAKDKSSKAKFSLQQTQLTGTGELSYQQGMLDANTALDLVKPMFSSTSSSRWMKQVVEALNQQQKIPAEILLSGKATSSSWKINSALDNIVKDSVKASANAELDKLKAEYQSKLNAKMADKLDMSEQELAQIGDLSAWVDDTEGSLQKLLDAKVDSFKEKQKDKLKDKVKDKLSKFF